jgi:membrane protein
LESPHDVPAMEMETPQSSLAPIALSATIVLPPPLQTLIERWPRLSFAVRFGWRLGERWGNDRCAIVAAALAFFGLLSLFPLMLAAIAILGHALAGRPGAVTQFVQFADGFFPGATGLILQQRIRGEVGSIAQAPSGVTVGVFSLLSLLWSGRAYFDTLAAVLNTIWPHARPRTWLQHQAALWSTFAGAGFLYALSIAASVAQNLARTLSDRLPNLFFNRQPMLWEWVGHATSWALSLFMFWMIYRFLPNATRGRRGRDALRASMVAAVALELAKLIFARYLPDSARYGAVYGSVAGVILTLMWLYLSSSIVLLGAEVAAAWADVQPEKADVVAELEAVTSLN